MLRMLFERGETVAGKSIQNCEGRTVFKRQLGDISDTSDILSTSCQEYKMGLSESSQVPEFF